MKRSESLPPFRRASWCFAWRYHALRRSVRSQRPRTHDRGPGVGHPVSPAGLGAWRGPGRPKFLGNPGVPLPSSPTPAGPSTPCPGGVPLLPPLCQRRRLRRVVLSRLNHTALALAVYASSGGLPTPGRKTRFRLLARLYRVGLVTHRVPTKGFQGVIVTSFPPLPSFLGAMTLYAVPKNAVGSDGNRASGPISSECHARIGPMESVTTLSYFHFSSLLLCGIKIGASG